MANKLSNATKWSAVTELLAKLISPVTNMLLARILTPEMFGIVATITLVVSFADVFSDAGFQKYIIQHDFKDEEDLNKSSNVAFTIHLLLSIILWFFISIFNTQIAELVGSPGTGLAIIVACVSLPVIAFSNIQIGRLRRQLEYKSLFFVRLVGILTPLLVTVPLAFLLKSYWALVLGTVTGNIVTTVFLFIYCEWKPRITFHKEILGEMFSFSMWASLDAIIIWLTSYVDVFIIVHCISTHELGVYKTSMVTVNQILSIATATINNILLATLARSQNDIETTRVVFNKFQKLTSLFVIPLGCGIFIYKDFITLVLLGSQWEQATGFIGIWGLIGGLYIVSGGFYSLLYVSQGKPSISVVAQVLYIAIIVATLMFTRHLSFEIMYTSRAMSRVLFIGVHLLLASCLFRMSSLDMIKNLSPALICSIIMSMLGFFLLKYNNEIWFQILSIILCALIYISFLLLFPSIRKNLNHILVTKIKTT